jgi:phospholipid-binding lipoprotein MlaA
MLNCKKIITSAIVILISSCATTKTVQKPISEIITKNKNDPYENFNRKVFLFNSYIDGYFFRPLTISYVAIIPKPIQIVVENIFTNLRDFVSLGNLILQLRLKDSVPQFMRISLNSTIGLFGIFDVAGDMGIPSQKITFGSTLKKYGWQHSTYIVTPIFGPSTIRDFLGTSPDIIFNPTWYIFYNPNISIILFLTNSIQQRAKLLGYDQLLATSLDPYVSVRDYYLKSINDLPNESNNNNYISIDDLIK